MASLFEEREGDMGLPGHQRRLALWCVLMFTTMGMLDSSVVNVALPTIARELQVTESASVWVVNAYQLAGAMTILTSSALGEVFGFRRVFVAGVLLFTLASLGCAMAGSLPLLVALRFLQGAGAYAAMCVIPALFRIIFPLRLLGTVLGINAMVVAITTAASPAVGGVLISLVHWSWIFALNIPIGVAAIWLALRAMPGDVGRGGRFDTAGALLSAFAMGSFVIAVDKLGHSLASSWGQAFLVLSLVSAWLFIKRQRSAPVPLLQLRIFKSRRFSIATGTAISAFVGQAIAFIALPFLFQGAYGYSPLNSALLFTPWPVAVMFSAPLAGRLADSYGAAVLASAGLLVLALGLCCLGLLGAQPTSMLDVMWRVFVCGLGYGFFQTPNNREFISSAPDSMLGNASGMLVISRTFGQALGATAVSIVLALYADTAGPSGLGADASIASLRIAAVAVFLAAGFSALRFRNR